MTSLFVFTAGDRAAREHLDGSIRKAIPLSVIENHLSQTELASAKHAASVAGGIYAWGATPGPRNIPTWKQMEEGDFVLTVYDSRYRFYSKVISKIHNKNAAKAIWNTTPDGETWEYIYFLTRPVPVNVHLDMLASPTLLHARYMGFSKISEERIKGIANRFGSLNALTLWMESSDHELPASRANSENALNDAATAEQEKGSFDVPNTKEARERVMRQIALRRGQPTFRARLIELQKGKCAVTRIDCLEVLEAAHILPYSVGGTNDPSNGLLLRSDIHNLFDLGLIAVDVREMTVSIAPSLKTTAYVAFDKQPLFAEDNLNVPNKIALAAHYLYFKFPDEEAISRTIGMPAESLRNFFKIGRLIES